MAALRGTTYLREYFGGAIVVLSKEWGRITVKNCGCKMKFGTVGIWMEVG